MPHPKNLEDTINWELTSAGNNRRTWHAYYGRNDLSLCERDIERIVPSRRVKASICPGCMRAAKLQRRGVGVLMYFRMTKGWYIGSLAKATGMDPSYLSRMEHGARHPTVDAVNRLSQTLMLNDEERNEMLVAFGFAPSSFKKLAWTHALEEVAGLQDQYSDEQLGTVENQILRLINFYRKYPEELPDVDDLHSRSQSDSRSCGASPTAEDEAGDRWESPGEEERLLQPEKVLQGPWRYSSAVSRGLPPRVEAL